MWVEIDNDDAIRCWFLFCSVFFVLLPNRTQKNAAASTRENWNILSSINEMSLIFLCFKLLCWFLCPSTLRFKVGLKFDTRLLNSIRFDSMIWISIYIPFFYCRERTDLFRRHLDESCEAAEPFNCEYKSSGFYAGWNLIGNECEMADGNEKFPFKILSQHK